MDNITLVVRILPSGDELDVELPPYTTIKELVSELFNSGQVEQRDQQGNPYTYELALKGTNTPIMEDKTLHDIGVKHGDTLLLMPRLVAG